MPGWNEWPNIQFSVAENYFGAWQSAGILPLVGYNVRSRAMNKLKVQMEASWSFSNYANLENDNMLWLLEKWKKMLSAWGHQSRNFGNSRSHVMAIRPRKAVSWNTCGPSMAQQCPTIHQLRSVNLNHLYWWTTCVLTDKILGLSYLKYPLN